MQIEEANLSIANLNGLIKQNRNAEFKSILSRANLSDLLNIGGKILRHTAAATGNIEIINFLSGSEFDIDAQNALGQTPLHLALLNRQFQAAQLLLSLDADILAIDDQGLSTLQLCLKRENKVPEYIIACFLTRLKRSGLSAEQMAGHLERAGCSINRVLIMNDAEVTGFILERRTSIDEEESRALLEHAMASDCPENVKVLLKRGPGSDKRLEIFIDKIADRKFEPEMKFYLGQLVNWDIFTTNDKDIFHATHLMARVIHTFQTEGEAGVNVYLDIGIDDYARKKFNWELLGALFDNKKVDYVKILESRRFNVNGLDISGYSALHQVAHSRNKAGMLYLLRKGADPNVKDTRGRTPLFDCWDDEMTELLLEAGADLQVIDDESQTIIDHAYNERLIANLCILEARGLLKQELTNAISNNLADFHLKLHYDMVHRRDVEWLKTREISKSATLFTALADEVENTARYVQSEADVAAALEASRGRKILPIYESMLRKNLEKAVKVNELRAKVAAFLANVMKIDQTDHLVIEKIIKLLTFRDLLVFDEIDVE